MLSDRGSFSCFFRHSTEAAPSCPERAEAPSPGQRPGVYWWFIKRPVRAKALSFAWYFKAFVLTGRQVCGHNYPGRCPGLGASALSGRVGCNLRTFFFCDLRTFFFCDLRTFFWKQQIPNPLRKAGWGNYDRFRFRQKISDCELQRILLESIEYSA